MGEAAFELLGYQRTKNPYDSDHGSGLAISRPKAMIVATTPSMRSALLSFAGLKFPAASWRTATFPAIQCRTGFHHPGRR